jgi:hypothetical protein
MPDRSEHDVRASLATARVTSRTSAGGAWVRGVLRGHRFEALVFPAHADQSEWELARSRISKLWVQRRADGRTVFSWDRGPDVPADDRATQAVVDALAAHLAEFVYPEGSAATEAAPAQVTCRRSDQGRSGAGPVFRTAREAAAHAKADRGTVAVLLDGGYRVVAREEADDLAAAGEAFAYVYDYHGRIVTVPVND